MERFAMGRDGPKHGIVRDFKTLPILIRIKKCLNKERIHASVDDKKQEESLVQHDPTSELSSVKARED
jgi:hypothetical protein